MGESYNYLFGPVPSRRLGRSLGVDLIPFKTCTLDCVYCQLGDTPCAVDEIADYVPIAEVLDELERWRTADGAADHITLAGSGEPTLHRDFGEVLKWVKTQTSIPSVLLTNGTLLYRPEVRAAAALADKVKVTLSAWDEASFQRIHRSAPGVTFEQLIAGERAFRAAFSGELSVEVFVVEGINSDPEAARRMAEVVDSIQPDRIDLNTAVRPPADSAVQAVSPEALAELAGVFGPKAVVTASFKTNETAHAEFSEAVVLSLIQRHPVTAQQLADDFGVSIERVDELLERMVNSGSLERELRGAETYFFCRASE